MAEYDETDYGWREVLQVVQHMEGVYLGDGHGYGRVSFKV